MTKLIMILCSTLGILCLNTAMAQEWIPYQPHQYYPPSVIQNYYHVYSPQPQPTVIYQWTPYVVQHNVTVYQRRLFCTTQHTVVQPAVQWVYRPVIVYR